MSQAITVTPKTIEEILSRLDRITKDITTIKARLFEQEPKYGSDAWWDKEIKEGLEEVKQGKYTVYENAKDLIKDLHAGR